MRQDKIIYAKNTTFIWIHFNMRQDKAKRIHFNMRQDKAKRIHFNMRQDNSRGTKRIQQKNGQELQ